MEQQGRSEGGGGMRPSSLFTATEPLNGGSTTTIFFFPGNPYVYELYHNLLLLLEQDGREHGVTTRLIEYATVPEDLLHDHTGAFQHIASDVKRQIDSHLSGRAEEGRRVVLVGHSFGSYIANMVVPHLQPDASIFIFPFLARPTLSGRFTLRVADFFYRRTPVGRMLHPHTTSLFNAILRRLSSPSKRDIAAAPEVLEAIFRVAACEGPEIAAKPDLSHVNVEGGRAYLIYTRGDQWCPTWVWEAWPEDRRMDLSHVPHAFPTDETHDQEVASAVLRVVSRMREAEAATSSSSTSVRARL